MVWGKMMLEASLKKSKSQQDHLNDCGDGEANIKKHHDVDPDNPFDVTYDDSKPESNDSDSEPESHADENSISHDSDVDPDFVANSQSESSSCSETYPMLSTSLPLVLSSTQSESDPQPSQPRIQESQTITHLHRRQSVTCNEKYKKPRRPCPYCGQLQAKLSRHLMRKHKDETGVTQAMQQPPKERNRLMDNLKKQGIFYSNTKANKIDRRERAQGSHEVVMCAGCKGFYSGRRVYQHKKKCSTEHALSTGVVKFYPVAPNASKEIKVTILDKFRNDEVGNLCRSDKAIVLLGTHLWSKSSKKERKVIMSDLRILGNLILKTRKRTNQPSFSGEDVVKRRNFNEISQTISEMTLRDDGTLKAGLKLSLGFILKKLIKVLKGEYVMQNSMEESAEIELFKAVLDYNWDSIFFTARVQCEANRTNLRKPKEMPLEEDIKKLRQFITEEMVRLCKDDYNFFDSHMFVRLRNIIVARLTMFNARRGGEPARILLKEWNDADLNVWVDPQLVQRVTDPLEKSMLEKYKLAYQSGKGSKMLVPVLIPNDTIQPLRKLVQERKAVGISDNNAFLFPNTGTSNDHVGGYIAVKYVTTLVEGLEKPELLIADKFRHRASTLFALLDVPQNERDVFNRHMGHSESINQNIYQCPLAIREITEVGNFLGQIDNSTAVYMEGNCNAETDGTVANIDPNDSFGTAVVTVPNQEEIVDGEAEVSTQIECLQI